MKPRRRSRPALSGLQPPSHLLGPGRAMPDGREPHEALYRWLQARDLTGYAPGQIDPLALLVHDPGQPWDAWLAAYLTRHTPTT